MASYLEQFNYQIVGPEKGRKWVFLHGLFGYAANWRKIVNSLESTERILSYDQRGHGRSMKPESGYAPDDYAYDLYKITEELSWERFVLVGHSMGGRNALAFASRYPQKLERLVIGDIGPEGDPSAPDFYKKLLNSVPTPFASKAEAREYFKNSFQKNAPPLDKPQDVGAFLYSNLATQEDGSIDWRFSKEAMFATVLQGRAKDQWSELRMLTMPTLVIRGENSKELSEEIFHKMQLANANIQGVTLANAGHWIHHDQPEAFLEALKNFVGV